MNLVKRILQRIEGNSQAASITFSGKFNTFKDALEQTSGYNADVIVEKAEKLASEFDNHKEKLNADLGKIIAEYGSLFALLTKLSFANDHRLNVLDFGGSGGYFYFQVKNFLGADHNITWTVVELDPIVQIGNKYYANHELSFSNDFGNAVLEKAPFLLLASGSLQYLEDPYEFLNQVLKYEFDYIFFDRTPFTKEKSYVQIQEVHKPIYEASYPFWILNYQDVVDKLSEKYRLWFDFPAYDKKIGKADALGMVFRKIDLS